MGIVTDLAEELLPPDPPEEEIEGAVELSELLDRLTEAPGAIAQAVVALVAESGAAPGWGAALAAPAAALSGLCHDPGLSALQRAAEERAGRLVSVSESRRLFRYLDQGQYDLDYERLECALDVVEAETEERAEKLAKLKSLVAAGKAAQEAKLALSR